MARSFQFNTCHTPTLSPSLTVVPAHAEILILPSTFASLPTNVMDLFLSVGSLHAQKGRRSLLQIDEFDEGVDLKGWKVGVLANLAKMTVMNKTIVNKTIVNKTIVNKNAANELLKDFDFQRPLAPNAPNKEKDVKMEAGEYSINRLFASIDTFSLEARTYIPDFTGDGLSDLIEISNVQFIYWQNKDHGAFDGAVVMGNSPSFSQYGDFDHDRLRLIDVDGTGTTDLLYILPAGGAMLFYNLAGNSWGDAIYIPMLPAITELNSVFMLDIEGRGTASLCWPDTSASSSLSEIRYISLVGKIKPFLLESYSNGLGHSTSVAYRPSTEFYLEDIAAGRPWTTKLPFPVQVVTTTEIKDEILGNSRLCKYTYRNGCYDHYKSQFAGFEMVEQVERQLLNIGNGETYGIPASLVKSRFNHTKNTLYIVYPREKEFIKKIKHDIISTNQSLGNVSHTQFWFTNEVMEDQYFRNPVPWHIEEVRKMDVSTYSDSKRTEPWEILEGEERALYLRADFSDTLLPGKIDEYSILDQSSAFAYTEKAVQKIEEGLQKCKTRLKPLPVLHDDSYQPVTKDTVSVADYLESQGYVKMAGETGVSYWVPLSKSLFSLSATGVEHLHEARKSFFVLTIHEDACKNHSHVKMDTEYLLVEAVTGACDNTTNFENDYEHLCPFKLTDINSNYHQVVLDTLGRVIVIEWHIKQNGGAKRSVLRTLAKGSLEAVKYLPIVGPVVQFVGQLALKYEDKKFKEQKRANENEALIQHGMKIGEERENDKWQKDVLKTVSTTAEKDMKNVMLNKRIYGREGQPAVRKNNNMNYGPKDDVAPTQSLRRDSVIGQAEPEGQDSLVVEDLDRPSIARRPNVSSEDGHIFNISKAARQRPLGTREQSLFGPKQNPGNKIMNS
ncbi:hypothetical protein COCC4DRAFT_36791 [Bipolaris maydis ATCC 48331]|nr:uncharacterized protein COCC4DRAFT_36791 [Bipolaris maydis ATCC 48331]ENI09216.1 hypothetical protein COCC4DRAFT_36791 [Bipolaris maydis ATCC 48331]KAJ5023613.1 insecticide toxin TcdB middle/N-terminal region-domain-containing protein [Bipolaris maydis]KAJ6269180.1 insecticide toxin TcdB middle/N-terminal region-domain-containing protein [Bipolaris maydis]